MTGISGSRSHRQSDLEWPPFTRQGNYTRVDPLLLVVMKMSSVHSNATTLKRQSTMSLECPGVGDGLLNENMIP